MSHIEFNSAALRKLESYLISRKIQQGFTLLDSIFSVPKVWNSGDSDVISLLLCVAQWSDLGYRDSKFFDSMVSAVTPKDCARIPVLDFLKVKLVEAYQCLANGQLEKSIALLETVLSVGNGLLPMNLIFLTHFWKGRVHRKKGEYEQALLHITAARECAQNADASKLIAVAKIHESWLIFQKGDRRSAFHLLDEAEAELKGTGHALSLGNIESARGRFVRRSGDYRQALCHFEAAIDMYSRSYKNHPNHARALVNAAYAKRLIALDMQPPIKGGKAIGTAHAHSYQISREALELLRRAGEIYAMHSHQGGTGSVLVNAGHIHLESGDIDRAATEAESAYTLGEEKHDQILMARARILQASIETDRSEEQLGENPDASWHANFAVRHAEEAIALARHTQNKRLLAEAYIVRGSAAASDYFQEWEVAREYAAKATNLLEDDDRDHLFKELQALKFLISRSNGIDQRFRLWSSGEVEGQTFQQIQEEFAGLVIPRVWINAGKNVSLVAQKLSMSPKKIRRILRATKYVED
jgi:tetratricopeptide (TPR) repeat protein